MKKFLSMLTLVAATLTLAIALPSAASAETYVDREGELSSGVTPATGGSISASEQRILDELNKGAQMGGMTFTFTASEMNASSNYLKRIEATDEQVNEVIAQIQKGRSIFEAQNIKVTGTETIHDIVRKMPVEVYRQLAASITAAGKPLGLTVTWNKGVATFTEASTVGAAGSVSIADKKGNTVISSGSAVKTTGLDLTVSALVLTTLIAVSAAGFALSKRKGSDHSLIAE